MSDRFQKLLDRIESRVALWQIIAGGGVVSVGGISAWLASVADWLDTFGAVAWWFASLIGALIAALFLAAIAWARYRWVAAAATKKWSEDVNTANPLEREFNKLRLRFSDLAHPMTREIKDKRFIDCDLFGRYYT